jgi:hypothetical protein
MRAVESATPKWTIPTSTDVWSYPGTAMPGGKADSASAFRQTGDTSLVKLEVGGRDPFGLCLPEPGKLVGKTCIEMATQDVLRCGHSLLGKARDVIDQFGHGRTIKGQPQTRPAGLAKQALGVARQVLIHRDDRFLGFNVMRKR